MTSYMSRPLSDLHDTSVLVLDTNCPVLAFIDTQRAFAREQRNHRKYNTLLAQNMANVDGHDAPMCLIQVEIKRLEPSATDPLARSATNLT